MAKTIDELKADIARLTKALAAEQDSAKKAQMQRDLDAAKAEVKILPMP